MAVSEGGGSSPLIWVNRFAGKSPSFNGRRQPSHGGTSRIMREYPVRICEGLGVQLPGPTRHVWTGAPGDRQEVDGGSPSR